MVDVYRSILVAIMKSWLRKKFDELGRDVGSNFEGLNLTKKEVRPIMLECLSLAFQQLSAELVQKWATQKD